MSRNWHAEDIKAEVRKSGVSLAELGRRKGVNPATVRKALYTPCPTANRMIAAYLGRPVQALWPEWFDRHGDRIVSKREKTSSRHGAESRQKRRAA